MRPLFLLVLLCGCDDGGDGSGRPRTPPSSTDALIGSARGGDAGRDALVAVDMAPLPLDAAPRVDLGCQPACTGRVCGDDGCGTLCGVCGDDERCSAGVCVVAGCSGGLSRCAGACRDTATDLEHCGGCDRACLALEGGRVRCDGECVYVCVADDGAPDVVDPMTDRRHCGACGNACEGACFDGVCVPADCRMVLEAIIDCLVVSPECPGVTADDAPRLLREGRMICEAPGLFGLVREQVAEADCPSIIELVGEVWCSVR